MHPILFKIPEFQCLGYGFPGYDIRTYGMAMAVGFIINIFIIGRRAFKEGIDVDLALNACFWIIIGTLVGGRVMYIVTDLKWFLANPLSMLKLWKGGLVFYGGFLGSFLATIIYMKLFRKKQMLPVSDLFSPYVGLGLAIHRNFGCFLNGCCFGAPTAGTWGVNFPENSPAADLYGINAHVHPTQVYEAINGLIIFYALLWWRGKRKNHGEMTGLLLCIYAVNRFIIEFFRGDPVRGNVGPLSTSQFTGLFVFLAGVIVFIYSRRHGMKIGQEERGTLSSPFEKI